jgi:hypothetical protein
MSKETIMFIIAIYVVLTLTLAIPLVGVRLLAAYENRAPSCDAGPRSMPD